MNIRPQSDSQGTAAVFVFRVFNAGFSSSIRLKKVKFNLWNDRVPFAHCDYNNPCKLGQIRIPPALYESYKFW